MAKTLISGLMLVLVFAGQGCNAGSAVTGEGPSTPNAPPRVDADKRDVPAPLPRGRVVRREKPLDNARGGPLDPAQCKPAPGKWMSIEGLPLPDGALGMIDAAASVAFSPDGSMLASGGEDGGIRLWRVVTGEEILKLKVDAGAVISVAFSPDGKIVASGGSDGTIRLWDAVAGKEVLKLLEGHEGPVSTVAFSPDGKTVASGGSDGTVRLWDAAAGNEVLKLKRQEEGVAVSSVAFSPDGKTVASASDNGEVLLWEAATGEEVLKLQGLLFLSVAFSPDGKMLAAGGVGTVLWEAATGEEILDLEGHEGLILSLAFSPDGKKLASGDGDGTIRLWETATGKEVLKLEGDGGVVSTVAFSPDGVTLASASSEFGLVWSLPALGGSALDTAIEDLWSDLFGQDAAKAWRSVWGLAGRAKETIDLVRGKLAPMPEERFKRLLAELDEEEVEARGRAEGELGALPGNLRSLREALKGGLSAEARGRIEDILRRWNSSSSGEPLRWSRAVQALERIGTEEAQKALEEIGTTDAEQALARLRKKRTTETRNH